MARARGDRHRARTGDAMRAATESEKDPGRCVGGVCALIADWSRCRLYWCRGCKAYWPWCFGAADENYPLCDNCAAKVGL